VRYEAVNAMLLNEFLKEHRKVEEQGRKEQEQGSQLAKQDRKVRELETTVTQLQSALKEHAAQIQKVSDQHRTQALAPRVVGND
jgi:seryl-tRNA synthetase